VDKVNEELEAVLKGFLIFGTVNVMVVPAAILAPFGLVKVMVFGEEAETTVEDTVVAELAPTVTETPWAIVMESEIAKLSSVGKAIWIWPVEGIALTFTKEKV
jgi:hypothetical protein